MTTIYELAETVREYLETVDRLRLVRERSSGRASDRNGVLRDLREKRDRLRRDIAVMLAEIEHEAYCVVRRPGNPWGC